jgi:hypothetical protein
MRRLLRRVWDDDRGSIISVEMILIIGILIFGLVPGLVALRNSTNAFLGSMANTFSLLSPNYTTTVITLPGGSTVLAYYQTNGSAKQVQAVQTPPMTAQLVVVPPAP